MPGLSSGGAKATDIRVSLKVVRRSFPQFKQCLRLQIFMTLKLSYDVIRSYVSPACGTASTQASTGAFYSVLQLLHYSALHSASTLVPLPLLIMLI